MKKQLLSFFVLFTLLLGGVYAQNRNITGRVTSATNGEPLSGVTVLVAGTGIATQTDGSGNYAISVSGSGSLHFTSVGYTDKTVQVGTQTTINVQLNNDNEDIDEVVVVGYGSGVASKNAVGSIARVGGKDIQGRPSANALEALTGRVAGLQVYTNSGEPSATPSIRLNGAGSISGGNTPLIVIDGIPVGDGAMASLNPDDFESVTVLRDASATSIYGARASNGVIYYTTKKGRVGERATITARAQHIWSSLARSEAQRNMMNSEELLNYWVNSGYRTQQQTDEIREQWPNDTYWTDYYFKQNVPMKEYNLNVSGGGGKTQYYFSTSYFDSEGVMHRSSFDRITLRSNLQTQLNKWTKVGLNLAGGYDRRELNGYTTNSLNGGLSILGLPWYTPFDENGNEYYDQQIPGLARWSPQYLADKFPSMDRRQTFTPTAFIEVAPVQGLILRSQAGMDYYNGRTSLRRMPSYLPNINNGTATEAWRQSLGRTITTTAEYKFELNPDHRFTALAGHEYQDFRDENFQGFGTGLADDRLIQLQHTTTGFTVGQQSTEYVFNSYFGRLGYDLLDKYFFSATLRNDASSRFGRDLESATFWSFGANWNMKREQFLQDQDWLTDLRFKGSIGTSGNAGRSIIGSTLSNFESLATIGTSAYNGQPGYGISTPGNPMLSWEKQRMINIGFDARLFDRVNFEAQVYDRNTSALLMSVPTPYTTGFDEILSNVGKLNNRGFNFNISVDVLRSADYYFTPFVNFEYVQNKMTELFQGRDYWVVPNTGISYVVGQPISYFYPMLKGVNPDNGNLEWYLPSSDVTQTITDPNSVTSTFSTATLQQNTGINRYAPVNGGFGFDAGYKGFFMNASFNFSVGKYLINNDAYFFSNPAQFPGFNQTKAVNDFWKAPGDQTEFPRIGVARQFDDSLIENASFLRLKNLSFGYQIPRALLSRTGFFQSARFYYIGRNVLTFTKFSGADPELDSNLALGINPNTKQHGFGIELMF